MYTNSQWGGSGNGMIQLHRASPANFLDIGGGASTKEVMDGFKILSGDANASPYLQPCNKVVTTWETY